jgi:hypothetical protein
MYDGNPKELGFTPALFGEDVFSDLLNPMRKSRFVVGLKL